MKLIRVSHLPMTELSQALIDSLLDAGEWLYRNEGGYVARLSMNKVFRQPQGHVTYDGDFNAGIIAWNS